MSFKSLRIVTLIISTLLFSLTSTAHNKVTVVPLVGGGSELKPMDTKNVLSRSKAFGDDGSIPRLSFPYDGVKTAIGITSITVNPDKYPPANLGNLTIKLERCRRGTNGNTVCTHLISVPNNRPTTIDFGVGIHLGYGYEAQHWIQIADRGGISIAHNINVFVSAYKYRID